MGITKSEMVIKGINNHNYYGLIFDVWNKMMDEKELKGLENRVYYTLSACYSVVAVIALVQLVRIQMRVPEFGWTTQKIFHLMNVLVNGLRAILFALYKLVYLIRPHELEVILLDLPGLLFFSTYTLLVLFWAEIYHQARSLPTDRLRPIYYSVNGIVYFIQIIIWLCMRIGRGHAALEAARLFFAVISFTAALGFLIYGGRLFIMLQRFPIESRGRQKKLFEVGCVTAICCTCFLVRCVVAAISAFDEDVDVDVMDHPIANLLYYLVVEIVPSGLVLFILRKLPPKRVSDQYHAIE
ncbi:tobamovirus multiplication protein 1-like [Silene latifolia]|uniref:tobamovirus multiplication protein 1-like n=1 Tax=Silene latifolia TaxID=37657 RepID=UPI003D780851